MTRLGLVVIVLLGGLTGCTETMDGELMGRIVLQIAGGIVAAFLLFLGFRDAIAGLSRRWRPSKRT